MPDDPKVQPVASVAVTVIGTGDGSMKVDTIAVTPGQQPNLTITVITPLVAVLVRSGHLFLTIFVGLVTAAMTPTGSNVIPTHDFLDLVLKCASLSVAGTVVGAVKDVITILGRLESKFPLSTGSV